MKRLDGKVAIVGGSGTGIGAATARRMVQEGARVVLADIDIKAAEQVAAELVAKGGDAVAHFYDLTAEDSIRNLIDWTVKRYGTLNILHNNAADTRSELLNADMGIADMKAETWDRTFQANARGTMLMTKYAIPVMLKAGGGSIINTSSGQAARGDVFHVAYAASKAAIECLTIYTATQYGRGGIRCNAVSPGVTLTQKVKSLLTDEFRNSALQHSLLPYIGEPEDVAAAVVFLASDDARNISGHILPVDGGYLTHGPHVGQMLAAGTNPNA